jgi:hypothetical protein
MSAAMTGDRYYKSDLRPLPVIFVQRKRSWSSFTPGGEMLEYCPGAIPEERMSGLEEIDEAEGRQWLSTEFARAVSLDGEEVWEKRRPAVDVGALVAFQPRRWRQWVFGPPMLFVLAYVVFAVVMIALGTSNPDSSLRKQLLFGLVLLVVVLFTFTMSLFRGRLSTYVLTVNATSRSAKAGFWRERPSSILLADVDKTGSARRGLVARLFGWQWLYSKHGARVMFFRRYFDPEVARELLRRLDVQP